MMNVKEVRKIIKDNNFDVKVTARTNGLVRATAFDTDDFVALNEILKNYGVAFKVYFTGSNFERYSLEPIKAN